MPIPVPVGSLVKLVIYGGAALIAASGAAYVALFGPRAKARRRLVATQTKELIDGEVVTVTGTVRQLAPLEALLSGQTCVAYAAIATQPATMVSYFDRVVMVPFELVTSQGTVLVDGNGRPPEIVTPASTLLPRDADRVRTAFEMHGYDAELGETSRCEEITICDGDEVKVHGRVLVEIGRPDGSSNYREAAQRIRIVPPENLQIVLARVKA